MFKPSCLINASFIANTTSALVSHVQSCFFLLVLFQTQDIIFVTERSRLITAVPAEIVDNKMQTLMLQKVCRTLNTACWYTSILVTKAVLVDTLGDNGEEVLGGVKQVRHHDLVQGTLTVTLLAKPKSMLGLAAILACYCTDTAWTAHRAPTYPV